MSDPSTNREAVFQELLGVARHSFLSYVVESSSPVVVTEADGKMMKLFKDLYEKDLHYVGRAYDLLEKGSVRPDPPMYALVSSNYNFLQPMKLAEHWPDAVSKEIAILTALEGKVAPSDPCQKEFERVRADLVALRRDSLKRVVELRAELAPKPAPAPAVAAPAAAAPPAAAPAPPKPAS